MRTIEFEIPKGFKIDKKKTTNDKIILKSVEDQFVDLGLPSGTLWANETEEGYYTYNEAVEKFQDSLPTIVDFAELVQYCKWEWQGESMLVTGPNGNSISLPALGYHSYDNKELYDAGTEGYYWTVTPYQKHPNHAYHLFFGECNSIQPASFACRSMCHPVCCIKRK